MPENRYDNTTSPDNNGNANDQAARVSTDQQRTNNQQVQVQAASAPDTSAQIQQTKPEQEVRQQQKTAQGMGIW
jgi:hypothetical protein